MKSYKKVGSIQFFETIKNPFFTQHNLINVLPHDIIELLMFEDQTSNFHILF